MPGFELHGDYLQIRGFMIRVFSCDTASYGISISGDHFLIEGNRFDETVDAGVRVDADSMSGRIRHNNFYHNVLNSIEIHGDDHIVECNQIESPIQQHPICAVNEDDANGVWVFGRGHILRDNRILGVRHSELTSDAHMDCFQTFGGWQDMDPEFNSDLLFERNFCDALTHTGDIDTAGSGFTIEDVTSETNSYADGTMIKNNTIVAASCVGGQEGTSWLSYLNNTCVTSDEIGGLEGTLGMDLWPDSSYGNSNYRILNNIYVGFDVPIYVNSDIWDGGTVESHHNLAFVSEGEPGTLYGGDTFACGEADNLCANPIFADFTPGLVDSDFHLLGSSPAIDAGDTLDEVQVDMEGATRPQMATWDLGAYEYTQR